MNSSQRALHVYLEYAHGSVHVHKPPHIFWLSPWYVSNNWKAVGSKCYHIKHKIKLSHNFHQLATIYVN